MEFENNAFGFTNPDDIDGFDPISTQQDNIDDSQQPEQQQQQDEDVFGLGMGEEQPESPQNNGGFDMMFQQTPSQQSSPTNKSTPSSPAINTGKSPAKQAWDEKKAKQLQQRQEQQKKVYQQNVTNGQKELADFQDKRGVHTAKIQATNRSEEKENKSELESTMKNGTEWEKVAKYCDLKPKHDPKVTQQPNNNERMRTLLIDLKNDKTQK